MRILKIHKNIKVNKSIGNMRITSQRCIRPIENSNRWDKYTEISCWYDRDCENCPMGWETRSYEGECDDCGCLFSYDFRVPIWKCMLPRWIKNIIAKSALGGNENA